MPSLMIVNVIIISQLWCEDGDDSNGDYGDKDDDNDDMIWDIP